MILALVEHEDGQAVETSLQGLTLARELAHRQGLPLEAIVFGNVESNAVAKYGAGVMHVIRHELLDGFAPEAWGRSLAALMESLKPEAVVAAGTDRGNEVMAHLGAETGLPMAANCTTVAPGDSYTVTRLRWGGSLLEEAELSGSIKLLTVAPHAVRAEPAPSPTEVEVVPFQPPLGERDVRVRVVRRVDPPAGKMSLADARVVVGGGRGVGSAEGFRALEELAGLLGGAVGCSRVVTSLGWRHHSDQVGQTGVRIAPDLYIACGISGAIQHMVGCRAAKTILAINTDPEAPIVTAAGYAVIGDVKEILPAINEEVRMALGK